MIIGIGTDIAQIERFLDNPNRLAEKILTEYELTEFSTARDKPLFIAKRWAAKEAISKAWGTGIVNDTRWKSIEIRHNLVGMPQVIFYDKLRYNADVLHANCMLTISDEIDYVVAFSIIESRK